MKILLAIGMVAVLSGCVTANVDNVRSDGCAWVQPIYFSQASITALREAQKQHPEVRKDRESVARHNILHRKFCLEQKKD